MSNPYADHFPVVLVPPEPKETPRRRPPAAEQIRTAAERIRKRRSRVDQEPEPYYGLFEPVVGEAIAELLDSIAADMDTNPGIPSHDWLHGLTIAKLMNSGDI
jgi:hypothetical protein